MANTSPIKFTHPLSESKFLMFNIDQCPDSYLRSIERDEFFEMIWYQDTSSKENNYHIYLIPPFVLPEFRLMERGVLISFKREYMEEDDKEYALDVFNLFNLQGQISLLSIMDETQQNLEYLHKLMLHEYTNGLGSFLVVKSILKVFLCCGVSKFT